MKKGFFVTLEGPDGAGKTTLLQNVASRLEKEGYPVFCTREPGGSSIGSAIRQIVLNGGEIEPMSEIFLFLADRYQHVKEKIIPALQEGKIVLCDRFNDSTFAYQSWRTDQTSEEILHLLELGSSGLKPDLTFYIKIDPERSLGRITDKDRIESKGVAFQKQLIEAYEFLLRKDPFRFCVLEGSYPPEEMAERAFDELRKRM